MWPSFSSHLDLAFVSMDPSHVVIGIVGLTVGYLVQSGTSTTNTLVDRPCSCHCACSIPTSEGARWDLYLVGFSLLGVFALGLAAFAWYSLRDLRGPEFSFSFKGKSGQGVYQARKGLQILDG